MNQQTVDIGSAKRITAGAEADHLAEAAYAALLADLTELSAEDWQRPTDCDAWTVRDMVAHLVGAAQGHASLPCFMRQYGWGMRHRNAFGGSSLDAMNQRQIDSQRAHSTDELVELLNDTASHAVTGRHRRARLLGWAPITLEATGSWYSGMPTKMTMSELCAIVLTRDVWMHRFDLARAVGKAPTLDPALDRRLVADVVTDWATRHGQPFTLTLTGDAGGRFQAGSSGQQLSLDALDFVRLMAGRRPDTDIPDSPLWAMKVLF